MDELAKQFSQVAEQYAPQVINASLMAAQISALSAMAGGLIAFVIAGTLWRVGKFVWQKGDKDDILYVPACLAYGSAGIAFCIGVWSFVDPWVWIALTRPEIYIAKRALGL